MNTKIRNILSLFTLLLLLAGCAKDSGLDTASGYEDDFKFYFNATIDNIPIEIRAGSGPYILNTDYSIDDSIITMSGTLSPEEDSIMRNAVIINLRGNQKIGSPSTFLLQDMLTEGRRSFSDPTGFKIDQTQADFKFTPDSISGSTYHNWQFSDGSVWTSDTPVIRLASAGSTNFRADLNTFYSSTCTAFTSQIINLEDGCDATFSIVQNLNTTLDLIVESHKGTIASVVWFVDESAIGSGTTLNHSFLNNGAFLIEAHINFDDGCTKVVKKKIRMVNSVFADCLVDFSYTRENVKIEDPAQLGTVEVIYYDAFGKRYTSYYANNDGDFEIKSLKPYLTNEKGQSTSRFLFEGSTILRSDDGSTVNITNAFGNFVVAHP